MVNLSGKRTIIGRTSGENALDTLISVRHQRGKPLNQPVTG
ncbi:hypothetical protein [Paenibacillus qinlingensis]|uniref:Uncharacterized protein n=1 Tax=Paenibacillus qinlingensis TaxID=1837343 RepID=A0ABU1NU83_9BACL|nr:hypothetical protein [Paenibacillus qinlingensis]MDR6550985.1 hypothetical protein [Paenibacillus qinlingensis]